MKKLVSTTVCLMLVAKFVCGAAMAQERSIRKSDVPSAILVAFEKTYPNAKVKGFSEEKDGDKLVYEIESAEGNTVRDVTYTANGAVVSVEETLPVSEFPDVVRAALTKDYPSVEVLKSEKIMKDAVVQYEVELKTGKNVVEVVFNSDGTIAKTEQKKRGEKD